MIHVILGMHKSGTTLISECLHHSGIEMVEAAEGDNGYDSGQKWEREATKAINHRLLDSANLHSLDVGSNHLPVVTADVETEMRRIAADLSAEHAHWGFKDPRSCLTYDVWRRILPVHRIIAIYRDPMAVLAHYRKQAAVDGRSCDDQKVLARWHEYNGAIARYFAEAAQPAIMLSYERFMAGDDELGRLEKFLGMPLCDRRKPELVRNHPTSSKKGLSGWFSQLRSVDTRVEEVKRTLEGLRAAPM